MMVSGHCQDVTSHGQHCTLGWVGLAAVRCPWLSGCASHAPALVVCLVLFGSGLWMRALKMLVERTNGDGDVPLVSLKRCPYLEVALASSHILII